MASGTKIKDVITAIELFAPVRHAFSFDRVGLQVGDPEARLTRAVVALDRSIGAVQYAESIGAELLLSHHPLIFTPLNSITSTSHTGKTALALASAQIAFVAAHTNWDAARGGVNDALATLLKLANLKEFGTASQVEGFKLVTFVPASHVESLINALSSAGAGSIGEYSRCAFVNEGLGTFEAGEDARPYIGEPGTRATVTEMRVEMHVAPNRVRTVTRALLSSHPYDAPSYDFVALNPVEEQPAGRCGELESKTFFRDFVEQVSKSLGTRCEAWGDPSKPVRKIAVVGGAADSEWMHAQRAGADVFVTGEVKQHVALEASESGLCVVSAGHYATEQPGVVALAERIKSHVLDVDWHVFEPNPGMHGRPFVG